MVELAELPPILSREEIEAARAAQLEADRAALEALHAQGKSGLGAAIHLIRQSLGDRTGQFATRINVVSSAVSQWESNARVPSDEALQKLGAIENGRWKVLLTEAKEAIHRQYWNEKKEEVIATLDHGALICAYRNLAHLEQTQVAELLNPKVDVSLVKRMEKGVYPRNKTTPTQLQSILKIPEEERARFQHIYWLKHDMPYLALLKEEPPASDFYALLGACLALLHKDQNEVATHVGCDLSSLNSWHNDGTSRHPPNEGNLEQFIALCKKTSDALPEEYQWFTPKAEERLCLAYAPLRTAALESQIKGLKVREAKTRTVREMGSEHKFDPLLIG